MRRHKSKQQLFLLWYLSLVLYYTGRTFADDSPVLDAPEEERNLTTLLVCEGGKASLSCPPGQHIVIHLANFGRFSLQPCNPTRNLEIDTLCVNDRTMPLLKQRCEKSQECSFEVGIDFFGDPCPGSVKYLEAKYECKSEPVKEDPVIEPMDLETVREKLASEQLVKLQEVKPINATAMVLTWKRQRKEPLVQGYYVKWSGPPLTEDHITQDHSWVNVSHPDADSTVVNGLRPFTDYEFFVIPYHQSVQGMPSNSLDGTTLEAPPSMPPSDVRIRMLNLTSLHISWRPPPADSINGILKGFILNLRSNQLEERDITRDEETTSITLYRLIAGASYSIRIAAKTNAGYGVYHTAETIVLDEETLRDHLRMTTTESQDLDIWYEQPWIVLVIGLVLGCLLLLMTFVLWYRCSHPISLSKTDRGFIKIRNGTVANKAASDASWASHDKFNGTLGPEGTVETNSSGVSPPGNRSVRECDGHSNHGEGFCYSDCGCSGCGTGPTIPQSMLYNMLQHSPNMQHSVNCSPLLRSQYPQSPPGHYYYAQLPEDNGRYGGRADNSRDGMPSFYSQSQCCDDPSPYATTVLVMNGQGTACRRDSRYPQHQFPRLAGSALHLANSPGPLLPVSPIPRQPPSSFVSRRPVAPEDDNGNSRHPLVFENGYLLISFE
ncbi:fibronectin type III domain-containing protein [Ditylenchus destructor]|nr:fibronectin type III domain-containing protein [Ditylenchus destructor]